MTSIENEKQEFEDEAYHLASAWITYLSTIHPDRVFRCKSSFEYDEFDYFVSQNEKLHHLLEVKCRRNSFEQYDTIIVPLLKYEFARDIKRHLKLYFLCEWDQGKRGWIDLSETPDRTGPITRADRGATFPHAFYRKERFKMLDEISLDKSGEVL